MSWKTNRVHDLTKRGPNQDEIISRSGFGSMEGSVVQKGIFCFEIPIEGGLLPDFVLRTILTRSEGWGPRAWRLEVRRLFSCCKRLRVHQELHFYGPNKKCETVASLGVNEHV